MIATILLLAQIITGYTVQDPYYPHSSYTTYSMPAPQSYLDADDRYTEAMRIGQPEFLQRGAYVDPGDGGYPIRTTVPKQYQQKMSLDQQMALDEAKVSQLQKEATLRSTMLSHKIAAKEHEYQLNTIDQSERFLDRISELDPDSDNYLEARANLSRELPLAAQNSSIQNNLKLLDQTHENQQNNKRILGRESELRATANRERDIDQGRTMAAKYGSKGLAMYEELLAKDPTQSPVGVMAKMVDAQEQQSRISQLKSAGLDDHRISQLYTDEVDASGRPTGNKIFDTDRADDVIKRMPSVSVAQKAASERAKIRESMHGAPFDEWEDEDLKNDYLFYGQQITQYQKLIGQPEEAPKPAGDIPQGPSSDFLFQKPKKAK